MGPTRSALQLEVGQFSHRGRRRRNNEDWLGTFQPDDAERLTSKGHLFLVADGMGGHQSGELASRIAVDQVIRGYVEEPGDDVAGGLRRAIESANSSLYAQSAPLAGRLRSGTTLVAAVVRGTELWVANVGDSRAYLLRAGEFRQLSRDHSLLPYRDGKASLEPERRGAHLITRALGTRPSVAVDLYPARKLRKGDRILLCSDGLTTPLSDEEIATILAAHGSQASAQALVQAANERGGPDNVSIIVIHVVGRAKAWALGSQPWLDTGRVVLNEILRLLPGADHGLQSGRFIAMIVLAVLTLVGLGFVLGLFLF
jgi:serine/threonine protein phosphatase PrpC